MDGGSFSKPFAESKDTSGQVEHGKEVRDAASMGQSSCGRSPEFTNREDGGTIEGRECFGTGSSKSDCRKEKGEGGNRTDQGEEGDQDGDQRRVKDTDTENELIEAFQLCVVKDAGLADDAAASSVSKSSMRRRKDRKTKAAAADDVARVPTLVIDSETSYLDKAVQCDIGRELDKDKSLVMDTLRAERERAAELALRAELQLAEFRRAHGYSEANFTEDEDSAALREVRNFISKMTPDDVVVSECSDEDIPVESGAKLMVHGAPEDWSEEQAKSFLTGAVPEAIEIQLYKPGQITFFVETMEVAHRVLEDLNFSLIGGFVAKVMILDTYEGSSDEEQDFEVEDFVEINGLTSAKGLLMNGLLGQIENIGHERATIRLDHQNERVLIKYANLRIVAKAT